MSVLQEWVEKIPLRQQGVLILALRGPDGVQKESAAKPLVRTLRALVMNSARLGVPMESGEFFVGDRFMTMAHIDSENIWDGVKEAFYQEWDSFNVHFVQHLMHAFAIVGMHHASLAIRARAWGLYNGCCRKLHCKPETHAEITHRLRDGIRAEEDE